MFQFEYVLNDDDYLAFNEFHMYNSPHQKKIVLRLRSIVPIVLLLALVWSIFRNKGLLEIGIQASLYLIFALVWFLFLARPLNTFFLKQTIKLMKKDGKLPYSKDTMIRFGEDYFIESTTEDESKVSYSKIEKIAIGTEAIYIYVSAAQAFMIPLSVFESEAQKEEFLAFINQKAKNATLK